MRGVQLQPGASPRPTRRLWERAGGLRMLESEDNEPLTRGGRRMNETELPIQNE